VRAVTDGTNKTLGFGIFYNMVNIGATFGPLIAAKLRVLSWNYAFIAAAASIGFMLVITLLFYKDPPRDIKGKTLGEKFKDIGIALSDIRFLFFLIILGLFGHFSTSQPCMLNFRLTRQPCMKISGLSPEHGLPI
jgi:dipeptide/tripeptide permease